MNRTPLPRPSPLPLCLLHQGAGVLDTDKVAHTACTPAPCFLHLTILSGGLFSDERRLHGAPGQAPASRAAGVRPAVKNNSFRDADTLDIPPLGSTGAKVLKHFHQVTEREMRVCGQGSCAFGASWRARLAHRAPGGQGGVGRACRPPTGVCRTGPPGCCGPSAGRRGCGWGGYSLSECGREVPEVTGRVCVPAFVCSFLGRGLPALSRPQDYRTVSPKLYTDPASACDLRFRGWATSGRDCTPQPCRGGWARNRDSTL